VEHAPIGARLEVEIDGAAIRLTGRWQPRLLQ
jgi:hypothetical protein